MSISETHYLQQFGEIKFGEIDNLCIEEYEESLENYLEINDFIYPNFLYDFGEVKFGEINNLYLREFGNSLRFYWK